MKFLRDEKRSIRRGRGWKAATKRLQDESGQTLIMVAISLTVLLGFVGFATDVGVLLHERREVQTAADAAALGAATEALTEGNPTSITTGITSAGQTDASINGFTNAANGATVTIAIAPNITVPAFNVAGYVQATITQTSSNIFMSMFGSSTTPVSATAIASNIITSNGCIYVPDPGGKAPEAVDMGGDSLITASSCGVVIDGNLDMTGNAGLNAGFTAVSGSITGNDPSGPYVSGVPPQGFPLSYLTTNTADQAQPTPATGKPTGCSPPAGAAAAGMTCMYDYQGGNMTGVAGKLPSNTVFYYDEPVTIAAPLTGVGDTIYLASTVSMAFNVGGSGTLTLSPPVPADPNEKCGQTGNPLCGVVIDAPTDGQTGGTYNCSSGNSTAPGKINFGFGSNVTSLTGIVYAPYAQLFLQDNGGKNKGATSMNTDLISGNICLQSSQATVNGLTSSYSPVTRAGLVY